MVSSDDDSAVGLELLRSWRGRGDLGVLGEGMALVDAVWFLE